MTCTRCDGSGFLNLHQVPPEVLAQVESLGHHDAVKQWINEQNEAGNPHDVQVCDCCGDGEEWYGNPGEHDHRDFGPKGPYRNNGGLPHCH